MLKITSEGAFAKCKAGKVKAAALQAKIDTADAVCKGLANTGPGAAVLCFKKLIIMEATVGKLNAANEACDLALTKTQKFVYYAFYAGKYLAYYAFKAA